MKNIEKATMLLKCKTLNEGSLIYKAPLKETIKTPATELENGDIQLCINKYTTNPVIIPHKDRYLNTLILGSTGADKTSQILLPMINQDMQNHECGITVIESKADLAEKVYAMAKHYGRKVVYFNPLLPDCPSFNPFFGDENDVIENISMTFRMLNSDYSQFFQDMNEQLIRYSVIVLKRLMGNKATFAELSMLIRNSDGIGRRMVINFSRLSAETEAIAKENRDIALWFLTQYFDEKSKTYEYCDGLRSKIAKIMSNTHLRQILNPDNEESDIDFNKHLTEGGVVVITTAQGVLGNLGEFLGYSLILNFQSAVLKRPGNKDSRIPQFLYVDEFQTYSNPGFKYMLSQGYSCRVGCHLATQNRTLMAMGGGQNNKNFIESISENARNIIIFPGINTVDTKYYSDQFSELLKYVIQRGIPVECCFSPLDLIYRELGEITYCVIQNNTIQPPGVGIIEYIPTELNEKLDAIIEEYNTTIKTNKVIKKRNLQTLDFKETLAEFFSLGLLNGNFYQNQEEVLKDANDIFQRALAECPEFATKCAIFGHKQNSLRLVPTVWLVYLSTLEDKTLFKKAFSQIISTFDMLYDFMEIARKGKVREGLGRGVKKVMNDRFISLLNEYQACRYKGTISEIAKVTRPINNDDNFQKIMKYVSKDELTFERIIALKGVIDKMLNGESSNEILQTIKENRLQLEELKHSTFKLTQEGKQKIYSALYEGINYSALVRNLVALERVFATKTESVEKYSQARGFFTQTIVLETDIPSAIVDMVSNRLNDVSMYRKSNMLPFGLLTAEKMSITPEFQQALGKMLRNTAEDSFKINKDISILLGVDTSGSMSGNMVNDSLDCAEVSSVFGSLIKKAHANTDVYAVASTMKKVNLNKQDDVFEMSRKIQATNVGCGTLFNQIMKHYNGQKYIILITDNEPADNLEKAWLSAKNKPEGAKLIIWKMVANKNKTSNDKSVAHVFGYSDRVLGLIKNIIEDKCGQVEEIEKIII
ncbi:MAG: hypothetical protein K0R54_154 [Clostridiaceae bacterium]|jgi:60 kDa SS-A/Ro ribonucleoprotein|nr:hypothetical protein [Clostridiaceae bacterium]